MQHVEELIQTLQLVLEPENNQPRYAITLTATKPLIEDPPRKNNLSTMDVMSGYLFEVSLCSVRHLL